MCRRSAAQSMTCALGLLDDVEVHVGGVCGSANPTYTEIGCRWEGGDFLCAETLHRTDTLWAERRGSRQFWLSSGEGMPLPNQSFFKHPVELIRDGMDTPLVTFQEFGEARVISTTRIGNQFVRLVASPSPTSGFDVAFFEAAIGRTPEGGGRVFTKALRQDPEPADRGQRSRHLPDRARACRRASRSQPCRWWRARLHFRPRWMWSQPPSSRFRRAGIPRSSGPGVNQRAGPRQP